jgi:hypothetical protein
MGGVASGRGEHEVGHLQDQLLSGDHLSWSLKACWHGARVCGTRLLHSRMLLVPTPAGVKPASGECIQYSMRMDRTAYLSGAHFSYRSHHKSCLTAEGLVRAMLVAQTSPNS